VSVAPLAAALLLDDLEGSRHRQAVPEKEAAACFLEQDSGVVTANIIRIQQLQPHDASAEQPIN